jgi:hypothetical protein
MKYEALVTAPVPSGLAAGHEVTVVDRCHWLVWKTAPCQFEGNLLVSHAEPHNPRADEGSCWLAKEDAAAVCGLT